MIVDNHVVNRKKMPKLIISSQNVCSLNVAKPGRKTHSKLITVTKSESDIIFLSDTRLISNIQIAGVNDIEKKLAFLGYTFLHNSNKNSRGTAILLINKMSYSIEDTYRDEDCNILMIKIKIADTTLTLGSIYGPNQDDEVFFDRINRTLVKFGSDYVIIGGDWNTTYDCRNSRQNIDIINTANIPSARRSMWLNRLCTDCKLLDLYRHFYPESREYTYIPYAAGATNRSRIDFFLMSESLRELCVDSRIPHGLNSTLFDHKQITLVFKRHNPYKKQTINDVILKDPDLVDIVNITAIECYINHLAPSATISDIEIENLRLTIGRVCSMYKELIVCRLADAEKGLDQLILDRIVDLRRAIKNSLDLMPGIDVLQTYDLSCSRSVFLEILIIAIKGSSLSHQHDFFKIKNAKKNTWKTK